MISKISNQDFINLSQSEVLLDVRSPAEYEHGHIPGAISFPLLDNEERAIVGTTYKKLGHETAVQKGFELVGHKFASFIHEANKIVPEKKITLYCWRGGLRSNTMAWVLSMAGFKVSVITGGYKSFRNYILNLFSEPFKLIVLGGKTGSGKTEMLSLLSFQNEQMIDLEALANHKGSAFGYLGMGKQPTYEQFENLIAWKLSKLDPSKNIWIENESRLIGSVKIPDTLYDQMRAAPVLELEISLEERVKRLVKEYGDFPKDILIEDTKKIGKRLGNLRMNQAINFLNEDNLEKWVEMVLDYYDKTYEYGKSLRDAKTITPFEIINSDFEAACKNILEKWNQQKLSVVS